MQERARGWNITLLPRALVRPLVQDQCEAIERKPSKPAPDPARHFRVVDRSASYGELADVQQVGPGHER